VTQVGAPVEEPVGSPAEGQVLAGRYRLDATVVQGPDGRAVWRGTDVVLNRAVGVEIRVPGGETAGEMLEAALTTGRVAHPSLLGVYDVVDEGSRAYVVREWANGKPLRDLLRDEGPLAPSRALGIIRGMADGLAAVHGVGTVHGNVHPGSVFVADGMEQDESTTRLTELRPGNGATPESDVRAIGATLYAALTAQWPAEARDSAQIAGLPEARRVDGRLCSPRQIRAGVPSYLDALAMDLLDPAVQAPSAAELAAELTRVDVADPDAGTLSSLATEPTQRRPTWRTGAVIATGIGAVLIAALLVATFAIQGVVNGNYPASPEPTKKSQAPARPQPVTIAAADVVDPKGDGQEEENADRAIDDDQETAWKTASYKGSRNFGNLKEGMGLRVDVGENGQASKVRQVIVRLDAEGADVELRAGDEDSDDPGDYETVGAPRPAAQSQVTFDVDPAQGHRYWMVWITGLAEDDENGYSIGIADISVQA
jgi:hypothetical protein